MTTRKLALIAVAGLGVAVSGCRNPFDPSANIELTSLRVYNSTTNSNMSSIALYPSELGDLTKLPYYNWTTTCHFTYSNKVTAYINTITIMYTNSSGTPVTPYAKTGGRTLKVTFRIEGVANNAGTDENQGYGTDLNLNVVDRRVVDEIIASDDKTFFADIVFQGQDENGYDLRLEGRIAIYYYKQ